MGDQNKKAMTERYWERITKLVGVVPVRVKNIMDLLELSGSDALAEVKEWSASIQKTIKDEGEAVYDEAIKRNTTTLSKFDIFGRHSDDLTKFVFTDGEQSSINRIARRIQERGILDFIHESNTAVPATVVVPIPSLPDIRRSLIARLGTYYETRKTYGIRKQDFNDLTVNILHQTQDKVTVQAQCVRNCGTSIKCIRTGSSWAVSNYTQHIFRKHSAPDDTEDSSYEPVETSELDDESHGSLEEGGCLNDDDDGDDVRRGRGRGQEDNHDVDDVRDDGNDHDGDDVRDDGNDHDVDDVRPGTSGITASTAQTGGRRRKRGPNVSMIIDQFDSGN